ncbi:putative probable Drug resistance protein YOR378W [Rosellinia necatrix]|uniref:Putative probable Drug resistance protein YOR378W n=1 Tax=Rosellinia necatrix TaxID=77044 RepID=A0A1W2TAF5_ROSNE|nr:putative probable Drug resistance protein YOR378W [Rosellinia necatrix]
MLSPPSFAASQGDQTIDAVEMMWDPSMAFTDHHRDDTTTSGSCDIEKNSEQDDRAYLFLGRSMNIAHELAFFAVVSTANFTPHSGFHQTLCILQLIASDLEATQPAQLAWLMAGYGLTVGTFILPAGRLGDIYGYKTLFLIGNLWFALSSLLAGFAIFIPLQTTSHVQARYTIFLLARILQGIGPALMIPNGVALLGVTYVPGQRKAMLFAIFGAMAPASAIISPAITSLFALVWWPYAFWAFAIVLVGVTVAGLYVIPNPQPAAEGENNGRERGHGFINLCTELDALGALTGVSGLIFISVALNQGSLAGWHHAYVPVLLGIGILLCAVFVFVEKRARKPLIPIEALNLGVGLVLAAVGCGWGCFGIYIFYIWEFYEVLRGASPLLATAWHSPIFVSGIAAAVTTGLIIHRVGPATVMALALLAFTVGITLIATAPIEQSYWLQTFFCNIIITWGMDLSFPAATLMLSDLVAHEHQGIAASLVTTVVNYSGALALGLAGTIELHANSGRHASENILRGYRGAWYLGICLGVTGLIISLAFACRFSRSFWVTAR